MAYFDNKWLSTYSKQRKIPLRWSRIKKILRSLATGSLGFKSPFSNALCRGSRVSYFCCEIKRKTNKKSNLSILFYPLFSLFRPITKHQRRSNKYITSDTSRLPVRNQLWRMYFPFTICDVICIQTSKAWSNLRFYVIRGHMCFREC